MASPRDLPQVRSEVADLRTEMADQRTEMADLRTEMAGLRTEADAVPELSRKQRRKQQKARRLAASSSSAFSSPETSGPASAPPESDASAPRPRIWYAPCPSAATGRPCGHSGSRQCRVRIVDAYVHTFECSAKRRWCGRRLLELFRDEFGLRTDYCGAAIRTGLVRVNGAVRTADYLIRDGDRVTHAIHRHEPSVHIADGSSADPSASAPGPSVVNHHASAGLVVVNKPSGIPVHPSGPLLHNSLIEWLALERPLPDGGRYLPVHRLDRLTSGLTLLATSSASAAAVGRQIADRAVRKHYVARVHGSFPPADPQSTTADAFGAFHCVVPEDGPVVLRVQPDGSEDGNGSWWRLEAPIECLDATDQHRRSVGTSAAPHSTRKPCETLVRLLRTLEDGGVNGVESVVECVPVTGRTHQLRVHLQFLGFPIVNDPLYRLLPPEPDANTEAKSEDDVEPSAEQQESRETPDNRAQGLETAAVALCARCRSPSESTVAALASVDYADESQALWLHAFRYRSSSWDLSVPLPAWAT